MKPDRPVVVTITKCRFRDTQTGFYQVSGYRLYCLDGANKVASAEWIDADDDDAAVEAAKHMLDGHECEVWKGTRLIARLNLRLNR